MPSMQHCYQYQLMKSLRSVSAASVSSFPFSPLLFKKQGAVRLSFDMMKGNYYLLVVEAGSLVTCKAQRTSLHSRESNEDEARKLCEELELCHYKLISACS